MTEQNNFGQYIGSHLDDDVTLSLPDLRQLPGRYCTPPVSGLLSPLNNHYV